MGKGEVDGFSLVEHTPAWGPIEGVPLLVGGLAPSDPAAVCLLVRTPSADEQAGARYRDPAPGNEVVGRLDASPSAGGLRAARRGERHAWTLLGVWLAALVGMGVVTDFMVFRLLYLVAQVVTKNVKLVEGSGSVRRQGEGH